jgi:hypothetical protein
MVVFERNLARRMDWSVAVKSGGLGEEHWKRMGGAWTEETISLQGLA